MNILRLSSIIGVITVSSLMISCNTSLNERFNEQTDRYVLPLSTSRLVSFGASRVGQADDEMFRCPAISEMSSETSLTVFHAKAHSPMPSFVLSSTPGIRSDAQGGVAVSLEDFPFGLLDVYERCNSPRAERFVSSCLPPKYKIVDRCSDNTVTPDNGGVRECVRLYEGTHELVMSAVTNGGDSCMSEEIDRTPYSLSTPSVAYACDAFSPMTLQAAYRGDSPNNMCCREEDRATLDFCFKPCGCRDIVVRVVPKGMVRHGMTGEQADPPADLVDDVLRVAVFSNVSGEKKSLRKMLASIKEKQVDLVVSLGNLTEDGSGGDFRKIRAIIDDALIKRDGMLDGQECGKIDDGRICCESEAGKGRRMVSVCNAVFHKTAFISGLGEDEMSANMSVYNDLYGTSYMSSFAGKVQMILLDTGDGTMSDAEMDWLKKVLASPKQEKCKIPAPPDGGQWPTLRECRQRFPGMAPEQVSCRDCINTEAFCITPKYDLSNHEYGPENCICVPMDSDVCPHNMWCDRMDGSEGACICTRDEDCGQGGTCEDGKCLPPMRIVFSYTPPFDKYGSRNNGFTSKEQAGTFLSLLSRAGVSAIFSGRSTDYNHYSMAGIPIYITGGGGAPMASFADVGHHWLYVEIPGAYSKPRPDEMKVEVVGF